MITQWGRVVMVWLSPHLVRDVSLINLRHCSERKQLSYHKYHLVGGFKYFLCSIIYGIILPIDELIFFRGVGQPPTRLLLTIINHHHIYIYINH